MLISFSGDEYFETNDVIGVKAFTGTIYSDTKGVPNKEFKYVKVYLTNGLSAEIRSDVIAVADVVKAINDARKEEGAALRESLKSISYDLNRMFGLMSQDGVSVRQI